jgi:hypothetical protein
MLCYLTVSAFSCSYMNNMLNVCYMYNIKMVLYIYIRHDYLWVIFKVVSLNTATWAQTRGRKRIECRGERSITHRFGDFNNSARYRISCTYLENGYSGPYVSCLYGQLFLRPQLILHRKCKDSFIKIPKHDIKKIPFRLESRSYISGQKEADGQTRRCK